MQVWVGFLILVAALLYLDLGVLNRKAHVIGTREALRWTALWVSCAVAFSVFVYYLYQLHWFGMGLDPRGAVLMDGARACKDFLGGYVLEESLSLDNVFVIALIFAYFAVPPENQHRTLFWGIVGAMVFRGLMIGIGARLLEQFAWTMYLFGAVLVVTAIRMIRLDDHGVEPEDNPLVKLARRVYPVSASYEGQRFFTRIEGVLMMTPLFLVLLVIESTDVVFAVDSIPAIFGITHDPFIVFTSNVFAILGLRSLYFVLAGMMQQFEFMQTALVFVLGFIGVKMLLHEVYPIPTDAALLVVAASLGLGVVASVVSARRRAADADQPDLPLEDSAA